MTICLRTPPPQPAGSETAGATAGAVKVLARRPSAGPGSERAPRSSSAGPRDVPPRARATQPGRTRSHTRAKAHSRQYPPGHQLLSIVTAGVSGKAQESRGKSGQRKNRRDCEKELWMKCEKQRRQGEENSSKPKMGTSAVSPHTPGGREHRAGGCHPQAREVQSGTSAHL